MAKEVLVVFTWRPIDLILEDGGSQAWTLNPVNARKCRYIVCTRNRHHESATNDFEHGAGFLVGRISGVELCEPENPNDTPRYLVRISNYALIDPKPNLWPGNRMPFCYFDTLAAIDIDEEKLEWTSMPAEPNHEEKGKSAVLEVHDLPLGLTIAEAKLGLSRKFGLSPDQIEITIRA